MYIISKKKDFYDGVVSTMGIDKSIVFNRDDVEIGENEYPKLFSHSKGYWNSLMNDTINNLHHHNIKKEHKGDYQAYNYFVIGFCGKLYLGMKLYTKSQNIFDGLTTKIIYDIDLITEIIENTGYRSNLIDEINYVRNYNALDIFRKFNTPVFVYDNDYNRISINDRNEHKFIINANIYEYEFYKIFDSFHAFQEIQMFISGVLGSGEKEIIKITDKDKIAQHGFDYKYSFRKDKENKK